MGIGRERKGRTCVGHEAFFAPFSMPKFTIVIFLKNIKNGENVFFVISTFKLTPDLHCVLDCLLLVLLSHGADVPPRVRVLGQANNEGGSGLRAVVTDL